MDNKKIVSKEFISDNIYIASYGWQKFMGDASYSCGYINSYKEAGDRLVEQTIPDLYIFPIMFCYRQYLEQVLKNICYKEMDNVDYKKFIEKASHNLLKIWKEAKKFLKRDINKKYIKFIEDVIEIFHSLDPNSFTFRYEFDKKLNRSLNEDELYINTFELMEKINKVDDYLYYTYGL